MLSFFKRYSFQRADKPASYYPFSFLTVCEYLAPMSQGMFEIADQSLEEAGNWFEQQNSQDFAVNLGHFSHQHIDTSDFQEALSLCLSRHSIPVILSNCAESVLPMLPAIINEHDETGIIHIGHTMNLNSTLEPRVGSGYHFALSRYQNVRLFFAGISEQDNKPATKEYAEDLGCDWVTEREFTFRYRNYVKQHMNNYLDHCDRVIIAIDLASLLDHSNLDETPALDVQMVLRTIRLCLISGKVKTILLIGDRERLIYSKQTKAILDELYHMAPLIDYAA